MEWIQIITIFYQRVNSNFFVFNLTYIRSLISYSDISKIKDEAFDFRRIRRYKTESTAAEEEEEEEDDDEDEDDDLDEGGEFFSDAEEISEASSFQAMTSTGKCLLLIRNIYF